MADKVADIAYPALIKKETAGGFYNTTKTKYGLRKRTYGCKYCGSGGTRIERVPVGTRVGKEYVEPIYTISKGSTTSTINYGKMPETKDQYILPV
jgi:hypothetical protein